MAIRSVATTDTLETFRTTFNTLGTDTGDLDNLNTVDKSSIVAALNEALAGTSEFTIRDSTSTTQVIEGGDTLNVIGSNNINAVVSATDRLTISLDTTVTGLTSLTSSTLTDGTATLTSGSITGVVNITGSGAGSITSMVNVSGSGTANFTTDVQVNSVSVATKPFAIAQAIALG